MQVIVANTNALERTTEMLSSNNASVRHESIAFLLELSETETLLENIGSTAGCILTLTTMKYNESAGSLAVEKAEKILKNLEKYPRNIKSMAEYGYLEPLLDHLVSGKSHNSTLLPITTVICSSLPGQKHLSIHVFFVAQKSKKVLCHS